MFNGLLVASPEDVADEHDDEEGCEGPDDVVDDALCLLLLACCATLVAVLLLFHNIIYSLRFTVYKFLEL